MSNPVALDALSLVGARRGGCAADLQLRDAAHERDAAHDVATEHAPWLLDETEAPLEAGGADPRGRAFDAPREEIDDGAAVDDQNRVVERLRERRGDGLLLGHAHAEDHEVGTRGADRVDVGVDGLEAVEASDDLAAALPLAEAESTTTRAICLP